MAIEAEKLPVGCFVFTADGEELGQLQEVHGEYFRVGSGENDVWLREDAAEEVNTGRLVLNLTENEIESQSVMPPPMHP